jgi:hypothetical protein
MSRWRSPPRTARDGSLQPGPTSSALFWCNVGLSLGQRISHEFRWYRKSIPYAMNTRVLRPMLLAKAIPRTTTQLVVFLTPGYQWKSGGIRSIELLYRESRNLQHLHHSTVVLCTIPDDPPLLRYNWFENQSSILHLEATLKRCDKLDALLLHIPEYAVNRVSAWLSANQQRLLARIGQVHLNVLLQNIDRIEGQDVVGLRQFGKVTCTTAHEAYTNQSVRERLGITLHRLSVIADPATYERSPYEAKDSLMIVSEDEHPLKTEVLTRLSRAFPKLQLTVIRNMKYEDYRLLIKRAKWSITFGEGLDGYFIEPLWCGGVSFAVYNERFFTSDYKQLRTVYPSWDVLLDRITGDMQRLDEPRAYAEYWKEEYEVSTRHYDIERTRENLRQFYRGEYTFP